MGSSSNALRVAFPVSQVSNCLAIVSKANFTTSSTRHRIRILYKHNPINNPLFENTFIRLLNLSHTSNRRRNTFTGLHDVARNTILDDSVREIVMMLEHNVLAKFKLSPGLKRLEQRELMEIGE